MPAANFATYSKSCPNPRSVNHTDGGGSPSYICHMAVMHWAFMDLGDNEATANARIQAIIQAKCHSCAAVAAVAAGGAGGAGGVVVGLPHGTINHEWYGANFCGHHGNTMIADRESLYAAANIGDVIITNHPNRPAHSMVVVGKNSSLGQKHVDVRGFNNFGTLGTGTQNEYDNGDRNIYQSKYWHRFGSETRFGMGFANGAWLWIVPYTNYLTRAAVVRNNCNNAAAGWTYTGP